jgi:ADP-dependent NAD(P)H-hydrate dehydratase
MALELIEAIPFLPARPANSHKGLFGTVLVIAGSRGMAGAAALSGAAALRSGAGLVRVACAAEVQPTVASFEPSYMTYPLPCDGEGRLRFEASLPILERFLANSDIVAAGPGLGQSDDINALVRYLIGDAGKPLVLDADGLNALAGKPDLLATARQPLVITPHPGEFARLTASTTAEVQANRLQRAAALAARTEWLVVLLKGADTIVTDGRRFYVNHTGNPGMATGGSGDVLTGVIAALMAQKLLAFDAALLGAFVHGLAGDIARDHHGEIGMIAGDIVDALPDAFLQYAPVE